MNLWFLPLYLTQFLIFSRSGSAITRVLAQRPIALVLMMINSCSYGTNDLVFN